MQRDLKFSDLVYWCPDEIIDFIIDEGLGIKRHPAIKSKEVYPYFFYVVTKELQVMKFSGLIMHAWLMKEYFEGRISSIKEQPPMTKQVTEAIRLFINEQVAKGLSNAS